MQQVETVCRNYLCDFLNMAQPPKCVKSHKTNDWRLTGHASMA